MRIASKESYLKKMRTILSFFFREEDVKSIVYDYEEQFAIAQECGNMPEMQRSSLKTPWRECREILAEEGISPVRALLTQKKFKIFLLLLLFVLSSGYIATRCEKSGVNFLYPAFGINFIIYITAWLIDADGTAEKQKFPVINILLLVYACVECLMVGLYMPNKVFHNVGATVVGVILTITIALVLTLAVILAASEKIQGYSLLTHHVVTITLITLYFVSQMHILQNDVSVFSFHIISGAIYIYCESIAFYLFRMGVNQFTKKYGRTIKTRNS